MSIQFWALFPFCAGQGGFHNPDDGLAEAISAAITGPELQHGEIALAP